MSEQDATVRVLLKCLKLDLLTLLPYPSHLLSKKSWNVYSPANRARVAQDEALAEAAARDAEKKRKDTESELRIGLLQQRAGDQPREIERSEDRGNAEQDALMKAATQGLGKGLGKLRNDSKKRKRLAGEDDTDRDIRYATTGRGAGGDDEGDGKLGLVKLRATKGKEMEAPIVDSKGNINLFPISQPKSGRKSEVDTEMARRKEMEENSGTRLTDALGRKNPKQSWYLDKDGSVKDTVGQDVWGNEDPRRNQREARRVLQADPLAFMKQAQGRLKEVRLERQERELALEWSRSKEDRELEEFSLDGPATAPENTQSKRRRRRDRSKSQEGSRRKGDRERRRSKSRDDPEKERRHHGRKRSRSPRRHRDHDQHRANFKSRH